jgi:rhodanese-related sulfurtransferase
MMPGDLKRIVLEGSILMAFAALIGLSLNHQLVLDAFSGNLSPAQCQTGQELSLSATMPLPAMISDVQQALAFDALIVDARSPELFALGHIEGAVSLPMVEIESELPGFIERIAGDRPVITYCSGFGCPDSFDLAVRLLAEGYLDVRVFEGGYPEWRDAGLPITGESR